MQVLREGAKARTGVPAQAGSAAAICILDPMSMAAAPTFAGLNPGPPPEVILDIVTPPSNRAAGVSPTSFSKERICRALGIE